MDEKNLVTPKFLTIGAALTLAVAATSCRPSEGPKGVGLDNGTVGAVQVP